MLSRIEDHRPVQLCYRYPDHQVLGHYIGFAGDPHQALRMVEKSGFSIVGTAKEERDQHDQPIYVVTVMPDQLSFPITTGIDMKQARETLGLSQRQAAKLLDAPLRTLQRWEAHGPHKTAARAMEWLMRGYRPPEFPSRERPATTPPPLKPRSH